MAADLCIHVRTPECTEEIMEAFFKSSLGSKYFSWNYKRDQELEDKAWHVMCETPRVGVGEVSWLKANLFNDPENFIPDVVGNISSLIGDEIIITDEVISKFEEIYKECSNNTSYNIVDKNEVINFIKEHKGDTIFTISW